MIKLQPSYTLRVQGYSQTVEVTLPITAQFTINKNLIYAQNETNITVYNLAPDTREQIYFDRFNMLEYRLVELYMGYNTKQTLIFQGTLNECYSIRNGVNIETHINAWDGGLFFSSGLISTSNAYKKPEEKIKQIVSETEERTNVSVGVLTKQKIDGETLRPSAYYGSSFEKIKQIAGEDFDVFVDDNKLNVLHTKTEVIEGVVKKINAETGLISTPRKREYMLEVSTIFEPLLKLGQQLTIESVTAPRFNGEYKVVSFTHSVTCSENQSAQNITTITLFYGDNGFLTIRGDE